MNPRKIDSSHYRSEELQNLLDLVLPSTTADTNIHTFSQFKQWINGEFHIKTQLNTASYIKKNEQVTRSVKVKQAKSLNDKIAEPHFLSTIKRKTSQLGLIQEKEGMESSYNTQYKQQSRKGSISGDLGFDLRENSIIASKSAHSSRSFNGYQQINQYQLRERLGKGSFAEVYLAYDTAGQKNEKYAVKVLESKQIKKKFLLRKNSQMIDNDHNNDDDDEQGTGIPKQKESLASLFVRNEVAILKKMNHQYITKLYDVIVDNQNSKVYLVLEYCAGGFINENKAEKGMYRKLLQSECKRYCKQISLALDYIHNIARIAHRDIKPQNLLLNDFDEVKISDFGLGTHKLKGKSQSGTPLFMSPESLSAGGESSSQPCDIWALGVTLLVMLLGRHPEFIDQKIDPEKEIALLKDVSDSCKDFIWHCLEVDASKRFVAAQLLEHPWLGMNETDMRGSHDPYHIEISPADELNIFKNIDKKPKVNIFQLSIE